jgi:hypothetical protein
MDYKALYDGLLKKYQLLEQENKRLLSIITSFNKVDCISQNSKTDCALNNKTDCVLEGQTDNGLPENKAYGTSQNNDADCALLNKIHKVTKLSTPEEKIALFRSLFRGREDVFARRWYSEKTGKSGYSPACENEWDQALCGKRHTKCNVCKNRKLQKEVV